MPRSLQLALGGSAIVAGLALGVIIAIAWAPCAAAAMPLDPAASPACALVATGGGTAWVGLLLWPVALAAAGLAAVRVIAHGWGALTAVAIVVLALGAVAANPMVEYVLLNQVPQSPDEPPGTGALTAALLAVAGAVLALTAKPSGSPRARRRRDLRWA